MQTIQIIALLSLAAACQQTPVKEQVHHDPPPTNEFFEPYQCGSVQRLHTLGGVFLASQPSAEDFAQAQLGGVRAVLDIRHDAETPDLNERAVVEGLGMTYLHRPWNGPDELTDAVFDDLRTILRDGEKPLLFHCGSANRVGAIWLAHRVLDGGLEVEAALAEAKTVGLKSPAYEQKALDYVRRQG